MFSLCGGIGPVVALLARPYLGARKSAAWAIGIDLVSYAMLMGFVYAYFIMVPSVVPADGRPSPQTTLLTLVQVQRLLLFAGLAGSRLVRAPTRPGATTFAGSPSATGVGFFLRLVTSGAISAGRYHEGSIYDLAWIVPFMAATCGPRSSRRRPTGDAETDAGARRLARRRRSRRRRCCSFRRSASACCACSRSAIRATRSGCC